MHHAKQKMRRMAAIMSTSDIHDEALGKFDTLPKMLQRNFLLYGNRVAMRKKSFGIWYQYTWSDVFRHVERICLGFCSLGTHEGDRVVIIGNNDPELVWAQWGAQLARLIVTCLYVDSLSDEVKYFVNDSGARFVVCEDQEQVDKLIQIKSDCPTIEKVIFWDHKGLWSYDEPYLLSLESLEKSGEEYKVEHSQLVEKNINEIRPDDTALIIYTSGTTGLPKGYMMNYECVFEYAKGGLRSYPVFPWDDFVSYASPAWGEQLLGMAIGPLFPLTLAFPEEPETVQADIRDIGPPFIWYPSRLWEDVVRQVRVKIMSTSWWKRSLFNQLMKISHARLTCMGNDKNVPIFTEALYRLGDFVVFRQVRDYFGLKNARVCASGGTGLSHEHLRFLRAIGVPICNMYGTTEVGLVSGLRPQDTEYDSIGQLNWGKEIRIDDGQIYVRLSYKALGYWKKPGVFEQKIKRGWCETGDTGWLDSKGYLFFIDRVEDMSSLSNGYRFSPQLIEMQLRFIPYIKDAIVLGAGEAYITTIVSCDFNMVSKWAESQHIPFTTLAELSQLPEVLQLLGEEIRKANNLLPQEINVKKFISLHKEFDPDEAELTRSRKLKRLEVTSKHSELIKAMYEDKDSVSVETVVMYKDGRKGRTRAVVTVGKVY